MAARSPLRSSTGPEVQTRLTFNSAAIIWARVVFTQPRIAVKAYDREPCLFPGCANIDSQIFLNSSWPMKSSSVPGRTLSSLCEILSSKPPIKFSLAAKGLLRVARKALPTSRSGSPANTVLPFPRILLPHSQDLRGPSRTSLKTDGIFAGAALWELACFQPVFQLQKNMLGCFWRLCPKTRARAGMSSCATMRTRSSGEYMDKIASAVRQPTLDMPVSISKACRSAKLAKPYSSRASSLTARKV